MEEQQIQREFIQKQERYVQKRNQILAILLLVLLIVVCYIINII